MVPVMEYIPVDSIGVFGLLDALIVAISTF